ncbi:MAG: nucleotidyltransferase domain-containing protein [Cyclobacteriaceae bacterium]|nr:nucleotidyltransferase domain-containing protein [Cyclobacteriaceae bacterium]
MFGLQQKDIDALKRCFAQYPEIEQVLLYGSRAMGNYRKGSDIDLTIKGNLDHRNLLKLETELDDLLLPYKIDLSLYHKIKNPDLAEYIQRVGLLFYKKPDKELYQKGIG